MLTDLERRILDFEAQYPTHSHVKADLIRAEFGMSPARYYQALGWLVDTIDARAYDPATVVRVLERRDRGRARRAA